MFCRSLDRRSSGAVISRSAAGRGIKMGRTYSALFVGNSYTFYNKLWDLFQKCAWSAGIDFTVDQVTSGGYCLAQFLDPEDPMHGEFEAKLREHHDFVILQDHSVGPIVDFERFRASVRTIAARLPRDTQAVLFETWGRHEGSGTLEKLGMTGKAMTLALAEAYGRVGRELGLPVSPVGTVFRRVYTEHPEIELYHPDLTHPSPAGSYLAALEHFTTVTGVSPERVTYDGGLDAGTAGILRAEAALGA